MLVGCGGSQPPIGAPGAMPQTSAHATHAERGTSWMDKLARRHALLYVSNYETSNVTVYDWHTRALVGTLYGFRDPTGLCVDRANDVYVTDFDEQVAIEFAHGATTPIKILHDTVGYPYGCAVDSKTGDVAVVNLYDGRDPVGSVLIYRHGAGAPQEYRAANIQDYYNAGYDGSGDLFLAGFYNATVAVAELARHGQEPKSITLERSIGCPGGVHWDGRYVVIGDAFAQRLYQFGIVGSRAKLKGTIALTVTGRVFQFWLPKFGPGTVSPQGKRVVTADYDGNQVTKFLYPEGGSPTKLYNDTTRQPNAVALSQGGE